jgi:MFS family permease
MDAAQPLPGAHAPSPDLPLLFATRMIRLFGYGLVSVVLVFHLTASGLSESQIGLLLTLTLLGDTAISLWLTTHADRFGRRQMLLAGALLMSFAGILFAVTQSFALLLLAATVGVISPSGNEVGPFLAVEQAVLAGEIPPERRTGIFASYNLVGSLATALGSLCGGGLAQILQSRGMAPLGSYRTVIFVYAGIGAALAVLFRQLSQAAEVAPRDKTQPTPQAPPERQPTGRPPKLAMRLGLESSHTNVLKLASLFTMDAFAGGFIVQAFVAYWFHQRFGVSLAALGSIFFAANVLAGLSALAASRLAKRIGLLATMVGTHIPSNILLLLVPLMPSLPLAIAVLLLRFSISQMDVPTRQAYTMALVSPSERSAAAGVTGIARTVGAALSPLIAGPLYASVALASAPFFIAGGLKLVYDLLVWRVFKNVPLEEARDSSPRAGRQGS